MSLLPHQIELLSPARDADIGIEAVNHGADAVYIGGPAFGARTSAGNDLRDLERLLAERKGQKDVRLEEFRWLLEELRVSFFAQELRTPQPVSVKRLEKVWQQLVQ